MITYLKSLQDYEEYTSIHPEMKTLNSEIFSSPLFNSLTISDTTQREPQWRLNFYSPTYDKGLQITEAQAVQYLMCNMGYKLDKAEIGEEAWYGNTPITLCPDKLKNFYRTIRGFFPKNQDAEVIQDKFYRSCAAATDGWTDDSRNFQKSKVAQYIMYFEPKKKYEKIQEGKGDYTEEEVSELNELYYKEEIAAHGNRMGTAIDRAIVNEKTAKRLLEDTGYAYSMTLYNIDTAWFDEDAVELCKLLVPDFWAALEKICMMITPNSSSTAAIIDDEETNPLCATRQYKKSARRAFNNFCATFHISEKDREEGGCKNLDEETFLQRQLEYTLAEVNDERGVTFASDKFYATVNELCMYYHLRKERVQSF